MTNLENATLANRYFLKKLAGEGGMAQVYKAWDPDRSTEVAIKVIHDLRFFESLVREAVVLGKLAHPNIVRLYSVEKDDEKRIIFIAMDWVDGKDLKAILEKRGTPLPLDDVGRILSDVHKALHYAHKMAVCHCDIKPANILLKNSDRHAILSDFGLAQATHGQGSGGTPAYMAPELFQGGQVSVASDIYALGVTLYQLLSCQLPFQAQTAQAYANAHINKPPVPIQTYNSRLPEGIVSLVGKALAKDPRQRHASVTDLWMDFMKHAGEATLHPRRQSSLLTGVKGEITGRRIPLAADQVRIGRSAHNDVRLRDMSVSREHALITCRRGKYYITDQNSSVGTYVNGKKISSGEVELRHGDKIRIGSTDVFEFELP